MRIDRRDFLRTVALTGISMSAPRSGYDVDMQEAAEAVAPPGGYAAEADRLTTATLRVFWDRRARMFHAPVRSAETVDSAPPHDRGYTVWPSLLGLHALVAGERVRPRQYRTHIAEIYAGLEQYYDPHHHAYNAWLRFPGNHDAYYDDNAWAVVTLVEAFEATGQVAYRERAREVMEGFLYGGWDDTNAPGGVRWGADPKVPGTGDHTACATGGSALAALLLARVGVAKRDNVEWAHRALDWIWIHLKDQDDLIRDGLQAPHGTMMETKWTYNTGVPIRAYVELYRLTNDPACLENAKRLARAATDRRKRLYDGLVRDPERRFFYDSSFFVPDLADGLLELHKETHDPLLLKEVRRNVHYAYAYLRDPQDGLYWRNWRLWRIGDAQYQTWRRLTGQEHRLEPDESERSREHRYEHVPVQERPLVKTLLANAGCARLFWLLARI